MASFLLVHGSWHGAWCWERLAPLLRDEGHEVRAVDLPAHGEDRTPPWLVTLHRYGACVAEAARGFAEKPLVVGHSMGGLAITQAAASDPEAFAGLIYLCAFAPLPGDSLVRLARLDVDTLIPESIRPALGGVHMRPERARAVFYADCAESDASRASARLCTDPLIPLWQRLRRSPPDTLPRAYIECTRDRALSIDRQRAMAERASIRRVLTIETDHSPFLSAPEELVAHLSKIAMG